MDSTSKEITQLHDPLYLVPREVFLQVCKYLTSTEICRTASTNRQWRDVIQSDPSLFKTLVSTFSGPNKASQIGQDEMRDGMNKVIKVSTDILVTQSST